MPKLIEYPRTNYTGAWELSEVVDDTGGKCTIEKTAEKMNRKVSGSFKAIIGSAVKFGLLTSKRELLSTTTLFKRIKHAYDKQEELQFHREAFLNPPLFTQLCRKFRNKELPVHMLDVLLIREFAVEEINALGVAKAFIDGCRMCGLLNEFDIIADIDNLTVPKTNRLTSPAFAAQMQPYVQNNTPNEQIDKTHSSDNSNKPKEENFKKLIQTDKLSNDSISSLFTEVSNHEDSTKSNTSEAMIDAKIDAVASLFNLYGTNQSQQKNTEKNDGGPNSSGEITVDEKGEPVHQSNQSKRLTAEEYKLEPLDKPIINKSSYLLGLSGPGISTNLELNEEADVLLAIAILEKIRRSFNSI